MGDNQIQEYEKKVEEMSIIVDKLEKRIRGLRSDAFQLANFYFVFQGVILTAVSRAPIASINCSNGWVLIAPSSLAAAVNLFALFTIGHKYLRTLSEQHFNQLEKQRYVQRLHQLRQGQSPQASNSENPVVIRSNDYCRQVKNSFVFFMCILLFLGFAGVTIAGCLRILCSRNECRRLPDNEKCINLCDGPRCIRVCSEY